MARALRACRILFGDLAIDARLVRAQALGGITIDVLSRCPRMGLAVEAFDSATTVRGKTGGDGTFVFALPHPGTYSLRVTRDAADPLVFPALRVLPDSFVQRLFPIPIEFEVEHGATPRLDSLHPIYPDPMRHLDVGGEVLTQFVVEPNGRMAEGSFKVLRSTDPTFTRAVLVALIAAEFIPATIRGVAVAQLVQYPFTFHLR